MMGHSKVTDLLEKTTSDASDNLPPIAEMQELRNILDGRGVFWEDNSTPLFCRTWFMWGKHAWSVVNGYHTYGYEAGLLELGNLDKNGHVTGEPKGWLTAQDVIKMTIGRKADT